MHPQLPPPPRPRSVAKRVREARRAGTHCLGVPPPPFELWDQHYVFAIVIISKLARMDVRIFTHVYFVISNVKLIHENKIASASSTKAPGCNYIANVRVFSNKRAPQAQLQARS
jgi:hypothetical protein